MPREARVFGIRSVWGEQGMGDMGAINAPGPEATEVAKTGRIRKSDVQNPHHVRNCVPAILLRTFPAFSI